MTRREILKSLAASAAVATLPRSFAASGKNANAPALPGRAQVLAYLETLARPDGGYAWADQEMSHLTPTYGVIGTYRLLGAEPPRKAALVEFVRTHHPRELKKLEQERRGFEYQQIQSLAWLDADIGEFRPRIADWKRPLAYMKAYEQHGYPVFQSELGAVYCRGLLGLPLAEIAPAFTEYIGARRRANGSFNNTPAADGGDGHVMNTLWGLKALALFGPSRALRDETVVWLQACQRPNGGFTYQPNPEFAGVDDVAYTRAAVRALKLLDASPVNREGCIVYLHSLANPDGGFGDRAGWASNASATFCAIDALDALGALDTLGRPGRQNRASRLREAPIAPPHDLKVYTIQIEAHGHGSPAEAVELARALRIDLWGAKNATPAWMARIREVASRAKVPVTFFPANEEYGTWVNVPGLGTYSHTSDIIAPPDRSGGESLANKGVVSWPEFRTRRLDSLVHDGGRLVWQFGENEELVRLYLDDSLERGGYAAISTYHFGNPDFTNTEPFLNRYRGRIPYIALQDSHGPEPWWFADVTTGTRTLFLAREPSWEGWLEALRQNWVVAVRHDAVSKGKTWFHAGSDPVLAFVRARESEWRWWDNPAIARPLVSLVALSPADEFETARPQRGVALRVRCAWETTPQGALKQPLAEFVRLLVDEREVTPQLVSKKRPNGLLDDHYQLLALEDAAAGKHTATAVVRELATKREIRRTIEFSV